MSEENQTPEALEVNYKELYEQALNEISEKDKSLQAVVKKKDELLNETKKAKADRELAERQSQEKNGEFEQLWKTEQDRNKTLEQKFNELNNEIRQKEIANKAMVLASELASHDATAAQLLSSFIEKDLSKFDEITPEIINTLKTQVSTNPLYAPLVAGNRSSGGGAPGNNSSSAVVQKVPENLTPVERMNLARGIK